MRTQSSENPNHILDQQDDSIDPILEWPDPTISDSERIRRANRRFEEWYRQEVELRMGRL
jgi:hypothetical protein